MVETLVFFSIVIGGLLLRLILRAEKPGNFRRKPILTGADTEFFHRLRKGLPDCIVVPHAALSSLIEPVGNPLSRRAGRRDLEGRRVGYAIFDEALKLIAVVELNRSSRLPLRERAKTAYLKSAGIRTVRFDVKRQPSEVTIRNSIFRPDPAKRNPTRHPHEPVEYQALGDPWRDA